MRRAKKDLVVLDGLNNRVILNNSFKLGKLTSNQLSSDIYFLFACFFVKWQGVYLYNRLLFRPFRMNELPEALTFPEPFFHMT